jgi:hypothetical protein
MMSNKSDVKQDSESSMKKSWLNRRSFVGWLIVLFAALNVWVFGKRNGWREPKLSIVVNGPFQLDRRISIDDALESVVTPKFLMIEDSSSGVGKLIVDFAFLGKVSSSRIIEIDVKLIASDGRVLHSDKKECRDARVNGGKPIRGPSLIGYRSTQNCESFRFDLEQLKHVDRVELQFTETS